MLLQGKNVEGWNGWDSQSHPAELGNLDDVVAGSSHDEFAFLFKLLDDLDDLLLGTFNVCDFNWSMFSRSSLSISAALVDIELRISSLTRRWIFKAIARSALSTSFSMCICLLSISVRSSKVNINSRICSARSDSIPRSWKSACLEPCNVENLSNGCNPGFSHHATCLFHFVC